MRTMLVTSRTIAGLDEGRFCDVDPGPQPPEGHFDAPTVALTLWVGGTWWSLAACADHVEQALVVAEQLGAVVTPSDRDSVYKQLATLVGA